MQKVSKTKSTRQDAERKFLTKIEYFASPTPELCQWERFSKVKTSDCKKGRKIFETLIFGKKLFT